MQRPYYKLLLGSLSNMHVNRGNNAATHALAKDALASNVNCLDLENVPTCVMNIILLNAS